LGYQGTTLTIPEKKPKGQPLSDEAKIYTGRAHASLRILVVEQVIGKVKIFNAMSERFRNERKRHTLMFKTLMFKNIAGLCNLRFAS
jgi:hypothetical protein